MPLTGRVSHDDSGWSMKMALWNTEKGSGSALEGKSLYFPESGDFSGVEDRNSRIDSEIVSQVFLKLFWKFTWELPASTQGASSYICVKTMV